jgi:hypothetical protein
MEAARHSGQAHGVQLQTHDEISFGRLLSLGSGARHHGKRRLQAAVKVRYEYSLKS